MLDQSGFSNDGALTGATRSTGKVGQGLSFTGAGGVTIPHSPSLDALPGGFTMSAWIYPTSFPEYTTLFFKTDRDHRVHMLHFQIGDNINLPTIEGRLYAAMNQEVSSGGLELIAPRTVRLREWQHVAWTYDEATARLYQDGVEVFSAAHADPWVGNDLDLLIGQHPAFSYAQFYGLIDEARIYRGALTAEEIRRDIDAAAIPELPTGLLVGLSFVAVLVVVAHKRLADR